jgi:2-dehydro-3-deoxygluconokinase
MTLKSSSNRIVAFGEIMMRLNPPGNQRIVHARSFDVTYAGGEANVAVSLANYGVPVDFVTRLPSNELGDACLTCLRQYGVGTAHVARGGDRLGIYFLETGATQRPSKVVYDRTGSAIATAEPSTFDWKRILTGASWFHVTGITPAISENCANATLEAVQTAQKLGVTVSVDLNYRSKLWKWGKSAGEVMADIVKSANVVVANEEDADKVFGIKAPSADVTSGKIVPSDYRAVAGKLHERFPNLTKVAITLRGSISASHNTWSAILLDQNSYYASQLFDIIPIVDRVGAGDAFSAGLIYGTLTYGEDTQKLLDFATAAGCLKHSIPGDANLVSVAEVETLMKGVASGRVQR